MTENEIPDYAAINQHALTEIGIELPDHPQTFEASKMTSHEVTPDQFLGPHY